MGVDRRGSISADFDQRVKHLVQAQSIGRVPLVDIAGDILDLTIIIGIGEHGRNVLLRSLEIENRRYDNQVDARAKEFHPTAGCLYISTEPWEPPAVRPSGDIIDEPSDPDPDPSNAARIDWPRVCLEVVNLAGGEALEPDEEILDGLFGELNGRAADPSQRQYWSARLWANYGPLADALLRCLDFTRHQVQDSTIAPWDREPHHIDAKLHVIIAGDLSDPLTSAVLVDVYSIASHVLSWPAISFSYLAYLDADVPPQRALNAYMVLYEMQEFARLEETRREQVAAWLEWQEANQAGSASAEGHGPSAAAAATAMESGTAGPHRLSQPRRNLPSDNYSRRTGATEIRFPRTGTLPFSRVLLYSRRPDPGKQVPTRHGRDDPIELGAELVFHLCYSRLLERVPQVQAPVLWEFGFINVGFLKVEIPIDAMLRYFIARQGADCFGLALEPLENERDFESELAEQQRSGDLARRTSPGGIPPTPTLDRVLTTVSTDYESYFPPSEFLNWVRSGFREWCRDWVQGSPEEYLSRSAGAHNLGGFEGQARRQLAQAYHLSSSNIFGGPRHRTLVELSTQLRAAVNADSGIPAADAAEQAAPEAGADPANAGAAVDGAAIQAAVTDARIAADDAIRGPTGQVWGQGQPRAGTTALRRFLNNQLLQPMRRALTEPYTKYFRAQQFHQWLSERFAANSPDLGAMHLQISDQVTALLEEFTRRAQTECDDREAEVLRIGQPRIAGWQAAVFALLMGVGAFYLARWLLELPQLLRWTESINPAWSIVFALVIVLIVRTWLLWAFRPDYSSLQIAMSDWVRAVGRARMLGQYANLARQLYPQAFTESMRSELEEYQLRLTTMHDAFTTCRDSFLNVVRETARDYHDIADRFTMVIDFSEPGAEEQTASRRIQFDFLDNQMLVEMMLQQRPDAAPDDVERWVQENLAGLINNQHVDSRYLRGIITGEHALDNSHTLLDEALNELRNYYQDDNGNPAAIVDHILLDDRRMWGLFRRSLMKFLTPENFMQGGELMLLESNPNSELERLLRRFIPNAAKAFAEQCQQLRLIDAMSRRYKDQPMVIAEEIADYSQELVSINPDAIELQQPPPAAPLAFILLPSESPIERRAIQGYASMQVDSKAPFTAELLAHALIRNLQTDFTLEPSSVHFERCRSSYLMLVLRMSYCRGFRGMRALADLSHRMTRRTGALDYLGSECHPAIHYHWTGHGLPLPGYEEFYDLESIFSQLHSQVQEHQRLVRAQASADSYARYSPSPAMVAWARQAIEGAESHIDRARALFNRFVELHRFDPEEIALPAGIEVDQISAGGLVYIFVLYAQAVELPIYYYTVELSVDARTESYGCAGLELETKPGHQQQVVFIDVIRETFERADFQSLRRRRYNQREMAELFDGWIRQRISQQRAARRQPGTDSERDGPSGSQAIEPASARGPILGATVPAATEPRTAERLADSSPPAAATGDEVAIHSGPDTAVPETTDLASPPPPTVDDAPVDPPQSPPAPTRGQPGDA